MAEVQEFRLKDPEMMEDRFFVEIPAGPDWQQWRNVFWGGEQAEVWYEPERTWLQATVDSWYIDDGSGNAPGANAHFFWKFEQNGEQYQLDMDRDQRIRLEAPTIAELIARPKCCEESVVIDEETRYNPATYGTCYAPVARQVRGSWYCGEHASEKERLYEAISQGGQL